MPRRYPFEFRRWVLDLLDDGGGVSEIACDLGIPNRTIHVWRRQEQIDRGLIAHGDTGAFSQDSVVRSRRRFRSGVGRPGISRASATPR